MFVVAGVAILIFFLATYALQTSTLSRGRAIVFGIAFAATYVGGVVTYRVLEPRPGANVVGASAPQPGATDANQTVAAATAPDSQKLDSLSTNGPKTQGSVDVAIVTSGGKLEVRGWALSVGGRPGARLIAILDHNKRLDITDIYRKPRPDVVNALKNPAALDSGFDGIVPTAGLSAGPHVIQIGVASAGVDAIQYPSNATHLFSLH